MKINEDLFQYFLNVGQQVTYHKDDIIYMQEDETTNLYLITRGRVRVYYMDANGKEVTYEILDRGRIIGESSSFLSSPRQTTVTALETVELISCHINDLSPYFLEAPELTITILKYMVENCDYLSKLLRESYTYNRYEKVASFLLETTKSMSVEDLLSGISYTHEELATHVGLNRVTVSKVLKEFEKRGIIIMKYRKIIIKNKEKLEKEINVM